MDVRTDIRICIHAYINTVQRTYMHTYIHTYTSGWELVLVATELGFKEYEVHEESLV